MTDFLNIHDDGHYFLDGIIEIPFTLSSVGLTAINKAYVEIETENTISTIEKPALLGFLYQESVDKRSKPYPIVSSQQSINLDFYSCTSFLFVPTNRLIDVYSLKLYVAYDGVSSSESIDLSNYATKSYVDTAIENISIPDLTDYALKSYVNNAIAAIDIDGVLDLRTNLNSLGSRLDSLESVPVSTISLSAIPVIANQRLEVNKSYVSTTNNLVCDLPANPSIGDFVSLHNGNFSSFRINHGNSAQQILNNSTLTTSGIDSGLILKPYGFIYLVFVGNNLWVSFDKYRTVNNWLSTSSLETTSTQKSYTATGLENYAYFSSYTINRINDGNESDGVMKSGGTNNFGVIATFANPIVLKQFRSYAGQFNGAFNRPSTISIYRGNAIDNSKLIYSANHADINNFVQNVTNDALEQQYLIYYTANQPDVSLLELQLFGLGSSGGEITVA